MAVQAVGERSVLEYLITEVRVECPELAEGLFLMHFVYILQCHDETYYVGSTQNVAERLEVHNSGEGPTFTARRLPVRVVYQESFPTLQEAVRREKQLKGWTRAKKEALISGNLKRLSELAACRGARLD